MQQDKQITVEADGLVHIISFFTNQYRSLMHLLYDKLYTDGFGECKGMGRCGTCMIEVLGNYYQPVSYTRNEEQTLAKHTTIVDNKRLACQLYVDENLDGLHIRLCVN